MVIVLRVLFLLPWLTLPLHKYTAILWLARISIQTGNYGQSRKL
jgi:hypothetical protein